MRSRHLQPICHVHKHKFMNFWNRSYRLVCRGIMIIKKYIAVLALVLLCCQHAQCKWVVQKNTCYDGADLYNIYTSSASRCRKACDKLSTCWIYTWVKYGSLARRCFLKGNNGWIEKSESFCDSGRWFEWYFVMEISNRLDGSVQYLGNKLW